MSNQFMFFRKDVLLTLLRSAAILSAFIVLSFPAHGETLDLLCTYKGAGDGTIRVKVDTGRVSETDVANVAAWPVVITWPLGDSHYYVTAISDASISFSDEWRGDYTAGVLDRIAGTLALSDSRGGSMQAPSQWACRRATQKF